MSHLFAKWKDLILPVTGMGVGGTIPAMTAVTGNINTYGFQTGDYLYGAFEIQHDYLEGSDLYVHIHWAPTTTNTGNCIFEFEYTLANVNATLPGSTTISETQAGSGVALRHQLAEFTTVISGVGRKIGDIVAFRIYRTAAGNTFTGLALMFSLGIHYQMDVTGSNQRTSKN